jgi:hypothetical protein
MTTERQIKANRANALKSTGPITPEGKQISSKNAALRGVLSGTVVLKGESLRRYNELAAALILQFQPRNSAETSLVQTMTVARWRLLRIWGIQTAGFQQEMAARTLPPVLEPFLPPPPSEAWPTTPASLRSSIASKPPMTANTIAPSPCY